MKSIYFIIGGYAYRLKAEDLFENDGKNLISLIRFINDEKNLWILGTPFFRKYNYLLDYDNLKFGINGEDIKDFNEQYEQWTVEVKEEEAKILSAPSGEKIIGIIGGGHHGHNFMRIGRDNSSDGDHNSNQRMHRKIIIIAPSGHHHHSNNQNIIGNNNNNNNNNNNEQEMNEKNNEDEDELS